MASAPLDTVDDVIADDGNVDPDRGQERQLSEVEGLAKEMGWDPDHKPSNGKPVRSAQEWIRSTQANNRNLRTELKEMRGTVNRIAAAADKQVRREVQSRAQEIEERFANAVDAKDTEGAAKAAKDMRDLEAEQAPAPSGNGDAVEQFQKDNAWYGSDAEATDYAQSVSNRLAREGIVEPSKQLSKVIEAVKKRFPEHFGGDTKPTPRTPSLGDPGSRVVGQPKAKTFADMPDIARAAADRFYTKAKERMGDKVPDRKAWDAQYAKDYYDDAGA